MSIDNEFLCTITYYKSFRVVCSTMPLAARAGMAQLLSKRKAERVFEIFFSTGVSEKRMIFHNWSGSWGGVGRQHTIESSWLTDVVLLYEELSHHTLWWCPWREWWFMFSQIKNQNKCWNWIWARLVQIWDLLQDVKYATISCPSPFSPSALFTFIYLAPY